MKITFRITDKDGGVEIEREVDATDEEKASKKLSQAQVISIAFSYVLDNADLVKQLAETSLKESQMIAVETNGGTEEK